MTATELFSPAEMERLRSETFVRTIEQHATIGSTSDRALELCRERLPPSPCLIVARQQTAGRGRGQNRWWSNEGALTFSLILEDLFSRLSTVVRPQISLTAGLAVCEAIREVTHRETSRISLKWPNDVYLGEKKVCGILAEVPSRPTESLILGIGVNVNNSFSDAPAELRQMATSISDDCGRRLPFLDLLIAILRRLEGEFMLLISGSRSHAERFREYCLLTGRKVCHRAAETETEGICRGIADDGGLLIETPHGVRKFHGGVLTSFERRTEREESQTTRGPV